MKRKIVKISLVLIATILIAIAPIYFIKTECQKALIYRDLSENVRYIDDVNIAIYKFPNRTSANKAAQVVSGSDDFTKITVMPVYSTLVEPWVCESEPITEYKKTGSFGDKDKFRAVISNGDILVTYPYALVAYQLSPFFAESNLLNLVEGRMIDFDSKNDDYIEIMVSEGFNAKVDDEIYFTVNGLDENYNQVVVKAKVVGIVEKGSFLYGCPSYCGRIEIADSLHKSIFGSEIVFTGDISYLYEYETEPNSFLDEDIPVFLIGTESKPNNFETDALMEANGGSRMVLYATDINIDNLKAQDDVSYGVLAGCSVFIILILCVDILIIKRIVHNTPKI